MTIKERVRECAQEALQNTDIDDDATFEELGADSLDIVELVQTVEEEFDIEISDEDADKLNTINKFVEYVESKI